MSPERGKVEQLCAKCDSTGLALEKHSGRVQRRQVEQMKRAELLMRRKEGDAFASASKPVTDEEGTRSPVFEFSFRMNDQAPEALPASPPAPAGARPSQAPPRRVPEPELPVLRWGAGPALRGAPGPPARARAAASLREALRDVGAASRAVFARAEASLEGVGLALADLQGRAGEQAARVHGLERELRCRVAEASALRQELARAEGEARAAERERRSAQQQRDADRARLAGEVAALEEECRELGRRAESSGTYAGHLEGIACGELGRLRGLLADLKKIDDAPMRASMDSLYASGTFLGFPSPKFRRRTGRGHRSGAVERQHAARRSFDVPDARGPDFDRSAGRQGTTGERKALADLTEASDGVAPHLPVGRPALHALSLNRPVTPEVGAAKLARPSAVSPPHGTVAPAAD